MHLHVYVKHPEAFIGIGRYIKRLIIIIIFKSANVFNYIVLKESKHNNGSGFANITNVCA